MKKRVIILGSTGSIGRNSLDVLDALSQQWEIVGLAAGSRHADLASQANKWRPQAVAMANNKAGPALKNALEYAPNIHTGDNALYKLVSETDCDCVVSAVVGADGLAATLRAVELGRRLALANKEALVIAGSLLMPLAEKTGATIIPVDSEHSAIFQALHTGKSEEVTRVILTASGGPFRTWSIKDMTKATLDDALDHPTWDMGPKISIDSATMMNKALEIVEAHWLFDLDAAQIEVVVHPESIIHSMVEFCDGSVIAQLGAPDMRTPIQYALTYPARTHGPAKRLDLTAAQTLRLEVPDETRFPALALGHEVARRGGTAGAVLNAANEAAVQLFRDERIKFTDISELTRQALQDHRFVAHPTMDELLEADRLARTEVTRCTTC